MFALIGLSSNAQQITFQKVYQGTHWGNYEDDGYSVQQTSDGGYIMVGYIHLGVTGDTTNVYLIKTNSYGDTLWTRTYGGNYESEGYCVQQTTDGGYIIAGETQDFGAGSYDVYLIKTKSTGDTLWTRTYGGPGADLGYTVRQTIDGGYIIAGHTNEFGTPFNGWNTYLVKTDHNGDLLWTKSYGNGAMFQEFGDYVQQTTDGGYIIGGTASDTLSATANILLMKTDSLGDILWTKTYGGMFYGAYGGSVQQTNDGGYVITGMSDTGQVYLIKTNSVGDTLWTKGIGWGRGSAVQQTTDSGYIIVSTYTNPYTNTYLIKTNSIGDTLWTRMFGTNISNTNNPQDVAFDVHQTSDGGYILCGYTITLSGIGWGGFYLIKTDSLGHSGCYEMTPPYMQNISQTPVGWISSEISSGGTIGSHVANVGREGIVTNLCSTEGIKEITSNNSISLYPNPTSGTFTLSYNSQLSTINSQLKIYDVLGQEVYTQPITNPNQTIINLPQLSNGVYFYQLNNNQESYRGKFVKD